jgi:hypothetical protein
MGALVVALVLLHGAQPGVCVANGDSPDAKVNPPQMVPPGQPPLFSFRYYEGKLHSRYGNRDLMMDDAGH